MIAKFYLKPVVKGRPRFSKWGTYTPKRTKDFEELLKGMVVKWLGEKPIPLFADELLMVKVYCGMVKPKTSKLLTPHGDVDNFGKAVLDAMNSILWADDKQIVSLLLEKAFETEDHILICVEPVRIVART